MTPVRLEPAALRSRVKHSTTEPLRSQEHVEKIIPERVFLFLSLLFEGMDILAGLMENLMEP